MGRHKKENKIKKTSNKSKTDRRRKTKGGERIVVFDRDTCTVVNDSSCNEFGIEMRNKKRKAEANLQKTRANLNDERQRSTHYEGSLHEMTRKYSNLGRERNAEKKRANNLQTDKNRLQDELVFLSIQFEYSQEAIDEYKTEIGDLKQEIIKKNSELDITRKELIETSAQILNLTLQKINNENNILHLEQDKKKLEHKIQVQETEITYLKTQLELQRKLAEKRLFHLFKLQVEKRILLKQNNVTQQKLDELYREQLNEKKNFEKQLTKIQTERLQEQQELRKQIDFLNKENYELRYMLHNAQEQRNDQNLKNRQLTISIEQTEHKLRILTKANRDLFIELMETSSTLITERLAYLKQIKELEIIRDKLQKSSNSKDVKLRNLNNKYDILRSDLDNLDREYDNIQRQLSEARSYIRQKENELSTKIHENERLLNNIKDKNSKIQFLETQNSQYINELQELRNDNQRLTDILNDKIRHIENLNKIHSEKVSMLQTQIETLEHNKNQELSSQWEYFQSLMKKQLIEYNAILHELKQEIQSKEQMIDTHVKIIDNLRIKINTQKNTHDKITKDLEQKLTDLTATKEELEAEIRSIPENAQKIIEQMGIKIKEQENMIRTIEEKLRQSNTDRIYVTHLEILKQELEKYNTELQKTISSLQQNVTNARRNANEAQARASVQESAQQMAKQAKKRMAEQQKHGKRPATNLVSVRNIQQRKNVRFGQKQGTMNVTVPIVAPHRPTTLGMSRPGTQKFYGGKKNKSKIQKDEKIEKEKKNKSKKEKKDKSKNKK